MLNGLVMLDVATGFLDCEPSRERDPELPPQTWVSLLVALRQNVSVTNDDGAFKAAAGGLKWRHDNYKPRESQANGLI